MVRNAWSKEVIPEMQLLCAGVVRPETGDNDSFLRVSGTKAVLGLVDAQRSRLRRGLTPRDVVPGGISKREGCV